MASRYFNQFPGSFRFGLKLLEGAVKIGASGTPVANSFVGGGISASSNVTVEALGQAAGTSGLYRLQLADPYYRLVHADIQAISPTSTYAAGSSAFVTDGNLIPGVAYQILAGTSANNAQYPSSGIAQLSPSTSTNWYTLGLYPGLNPQIGQVFVATSGGSNIPGSSTVGYGQGQVARVIQSGVEQIEVLPGYNTMLAPTSASSGVQGALVYFQTLTSSTSVSNSPAWPLQNTWLRWNLWLDNSNRTLYNESTTAN